MLCEKRMNFLERFRMQWLKMSALISSSTDCEVKFDCYCKILQKLWWVIHNKICRMLIAVVLIHDNIHPHMAHCTTQLEYKYHWEMFDHPSYSPRNEPRAE